jgi:putative membrane protein
VAAAPRGTGETMSTILTKEEQARLARLIGEVERSTAGEIVTVVLHKSASYASYRIAGAALLALLCASVSHLTWPWLTAMELLGGQSLLGIAIYSLLGWPAMLRRLVPRVVQRKAVSDRVKQLFIEHGVTETRDRSGVLILLSALERRVEILGDRGIHEHLGDDTWRAMVKELTQAIGNGKAADGLAKIIERLGRELSSKFPARPDDSDELPNRIVTDD